MSDAHDDDRARHRDLDAARGGDDTARLTAELDRQKRESRVVSLPSPPLTRVGTNDSLRLRTPSPVRPGDDTDVEDSTWHPLHADTPPPAPTPTENDVVDASGRLLYPVQPSPAPSPNASYAYIGRKTPSPQPWDVVSPPSDDHAGDFYSAGSHKFHTLQSSSQPRPLKPKSSYYFGPPPPGSAYGTRPIGQIGVHHPREVLRIERDYTGGELPQFAPIYPLELDGRITPTQFLESINALNELLISAHSVRHAMLENLLAVFTLQLSRLFFRSHYTKEMQRLQRLIADLNAQIYNPVGLNMLWPQTVAFLFLEIEYY